MRLAFGFLSLVAVLHGTAAMLGSTRGEWGMAVALCVLAAAWAVQRFLHGEYLASVGIRSGTGGIVLAAALSTLLAGFAAMYLLATDARAGLYPDSALLALGIMAQGGLAEELVFRGYLYGHLRRTRRFWRAASVSMVPFAAVHLSAFFTMDWPIALAALLLAIALSFPYARLYDLAGGTLWPAALLHAVTQAGPKLVVVDDPSFPLVWMAAALALSWSVFLLPGNHKQMA